MYFFDGLEQFSGLVMTLHGVFDESGKHNDCDVIVFGGLILDPAEIRNRFNRQWFTQLRESQIPFPQGRYGPFLHMKELHRLHRKSDRESQIKIETLAKRLSQSVCDSASGASWSAISVQEFRALRPENRKRYKDPFYYAFEHGVVGLTKDHCIGPTDDLALVCDNSDDAVRCLESFINLKKSDPVVADKIPVIAFGDDKVYPPLQAADMLAHSYRAFKAKSEPGLWGVVLETIAERFTDISRDLIVLDGDGSIAKE